VSDFTNQTEASASFASTVLDTGVDFTSVSDADAQFAKFELDDGVDFNPTGDAGTLTQGGTGFGEGGFGEGPFGGTITYSLNYNTTLWRNIDTP